MEVYVNRVKRVRELMEERDIQCLFTAPSSNIFYLTGVKTTLDERLQLAVLSREGPLFLVLPEMYKEAASDLGEGFELLTWADQQDPMEPVREACGTIKGRAAVDPKLWAGHLLRLMETFKDCTFVDAGELLGKVRSIKDEEELRCLKKAGELADEVMGEVLKEISVGMTELELAHFIERKIKEKGADDISFKPIVASGPNGAMPHHIPGDRNIEKGDLVVLDFGAVLEGYCSDITRTVFVGKAGNEEKEIYRIVMEANEAGYRAAVTGALCGDVDRAAREVIDRAGYGRFFIHRTGHGIGLDYHEEPYIVEGSKVSLEKGMVFSVEPGIYIPQRFGIRIEDIVAVTDRGPVRLNNFPRELVEV
ncbi:MAG: aminopeptidase P family protein [Clostridia bacterium]|nr:aminopeptidase P family protein [Clostridia bacterium]